MGSQVKEIIARIIQREGGYVDHPDDSGGATNWGISEKVARSWGYKEPMAAMPESVAIEMYKTLYWNAIKGDDLVKRASSVAEEVMDTSVNMGVPAASKLLQRALNLFNQQGAFYRDIVEDGLIGPATVGALVAYLKRRPDDGERVLVYTLNIFQGMRYIELAERRQKDETFIYGWLLNRVGI